MSEDTTTEPGSDAQLTAGQRDRLDDRLAVALLAVEAEEQRTAEQPVTGRDGPRYAH